MIYPKKIIREFAILKMNNYELCPMKWRKHLYELQAAHLYPTMRHLVIFADTIHQVAQTENLVVCVLLREGVNNMNDIKQIQLLKDAIELYENGAILEAKDKAIEFINNITDFENAPYQKGGKK